jgi:hypothetical protein
MVVRVHGITDAMVKGAPPAGDAIRAWLRFAAGRPVLAHNASFDHRIIAQECRRTGVGAAGVWFWCTKRFAKAAFPKAPGYGLAVLSQWLKLPSPPAHRALADCATTHGLLAACRKRLARAFARCIPDIAPRFKFRYKILKRVVPVRQAMLLVDFPHPLQRLFHVPAGMGHELEEQVAQLLEPAASVPVGPILVKSESAHGVKLACKQGGTGDVRGMNLRAEPVVTFVPWRTVLTPSTTTGAGRAPSTSAD